MIGRNGERRSGISAQAARHDDDDDCQNHPYRIVVVLFDSLLGIHLLILISD